MVSNQIRKLISSLLYITFEYNVCFICEKKKKIVIGKNQIQKAFGTLVKRCTMQLQNYDDWQNFVIA